MPVKINAYACEFRCGFVRTSKARVVKHEPTCSMNPTRRGCGTCKHFEKGTDDNGMEAGPYRQEWPFSECDRYEDLLQEPTQKNPYGMVFDCKRWEPIND